MTTGVLGNRNAGSDDTLRSQDYVSLYNQSFKSTNLENQLLIKVKNYDENSGDRSSPNTKKTSLKITHGINKAAGDEFIILEQESNE